MRFCYGLLLVFFFNLFSFSQKIPKGYTLVDLEILKSNNEPLRNENITFSNKNTNLGISVFTDDDGKCSVLLKQKEKYNIYFWDKEYTRMLPIPKAQKFSYPIPILIDEGLFATVIFDYMNYDGESIPNEWVQCTDNITGKIYTAITDFEGKAYFYVPRGHEYSFDIKTIHNIRTYHVKMAEGYSSYEVRVPIVAYSSENYKQNQENYRLQEIEFEKLEKHNDSIIAVTPVSVLLFFNNESGNEFPKFKVYDSSKKENLLGQIDAAWKVKDMCGNDRRLCLGSFEGIPKTWNAFIPTKLTRGKHTFYIESLDGSIKKEIEVDIPVYCHPDHLNTYKVSAPICY